MNPGCFCRPCQFKPEQAVIGTLRPRSTKDHAKHLDMAAYAVKVKGPVLAEPLKIAAIGGGLSGFFTKPSNSWLTISNRFYLSYYHYIIPILSFPKCIILKMVN